MRPFNYLSVLALGGMAIMSVIAAPAPASEAITTVTTTQASVTSSENAPALAIYSEVCLCRFSR